MGGMVETRDHDLATRAIGGDADAFSQLIAQRRAWMVDHAERLTHNRASAEDVTQRACLRAWVFIRNLREPKFFSLWLRRIVTTEAYRYSRANRWLIPAAEPSDRPSPAPSPDRQLTARDGLARVNAELKTMAPDAVRVFLLSAVDGMRNEDVAKAEGIHLSTMKTRIHRIRLRLRAVCAGKGGYE